MNVLVSCVGFSNNFKTNIQIFIYIKINLFKTFTQNGLFLKSGNPGRNTRATLSFETTLYCRNLSTLGLGFMISVYVNWAEESWKTNRLQFEGCILEKVYSPISAAATRFLQNWNPYILVFIFVVNSVASSFLVQTLLKSVFI